MNGPEIEIRRPRIGVWVLCILSAIIIGASGWYIGNHFGHETAYRAEYERGYQEGQEAGHRDGFDLGYASGHSAGYKDAVEDMKNGNVEIKNPVIEELNRGKK